LQYTKVAICPGLDGMIPVSLSCPGIPVDWLWIQISTFLTSNRPYTHITKLVSRRRYLFWNSLVSTQTFIVHCWREEKQTKHVYQTIVVGTVFLWLSAVLGDPIWGQLALDLQCECPILWYVSDRMSESKCGI
jgi:hypothetical protein